MSLPQVSVIWAGACGNGRVGAEAVTLSVLVTGTSRTPDAADASLVDSRYAEGQRLYLDACRPSELATTVIDNNVLDGPQLVG